MWLALFGLLATWFVQRPAPSPAAGAPDFEFFKTRVQPILLAKRLGHARCYACHSIGTPLRLERLTPGMTTWSDEQSRKNFTAVLREVRPGNPLASRLLTHPLEEAAGGDTFHNGGKHWSAQGDPEWQTLAAWVRGDRSEPAATIAARTGHVRILQTNSAGDSVHIIDPATNKVVGEIKDIEVNHGAAVAPDGSRIYVSNEADTTLDVADGRTLKVTKKIPLSGHPNNIAISRDGRRVYVSIAEAPGAVDVIDTASLERVKSIPVKGAAHNTYVTPDGKFVVTGSVAGHTLTVIDGQSEQPVWSMTFENGVRPITFEQNADGSTKRMFVQVSELHGFAVVDFATHAEVARITLPEVTGAKKNIEGIQGAPSHGIGITPDGKTLWATSKWYDYVFAYSLPDLKLVGRAKVGMDPDWLTFTPDSKSLYVACAGSNAVSVVDVQSRKEVARIPVGSVPKRNITAVLP